MMLNRAPVLDGVLVSEQGSKMKDQTWLLAKRLIQTTVVLQRTLDEHAVYIFEVLSEAGAKIVEDNDRGVSLNKMANEAAADGTGPARDEYGLVSEIVTHVPRYAQPEPQVVAPVVPVLVCML